METNSGFKISEPYEKISRPYKLKTNISTETQTEYLPTYSNSFTPKFYKPRTITKLNLPENPALHFNENLTRDLNKHQQFYSKSLESMEPLKIYTKPNPNLQKYSGIFILLLFFKHF